MFGTLSNRQQRVSPTISIDLLDVAVDGFTPRSLVDIKESKPLNVVLEQLTSQTNTCYTLCVYCDSHVISNMKLYLHELSIIKKIIKSLNSKKIIHGRTEYASKYPTGE